MNKDSISEEPVIQHKKKLSNIDIAISATGALAIIYVLSRSAKAETISTYSCSGSPNYQCTEDSYGIYDTITKCNNNCKQITAVQYCKSPTETPTSNYIRISDYFAVHNNLWGVCNSPAETNYRFCIYQNAIDTDYGWSWKRNDPKTSCGCGTWICPTFQQLVLGDMWGNSVTKGPNTSIFPFDSNNIPLGVKTDNINSWMSTLEWAWPLVPFGGWYNLAYDIYIMDQPDSPSGIKDNFMIWLVGNYSSGGTAFSDGINNYRYFFEMRDFGSGVIKPYHVFQLNNESTSLTSNIVNLKAMLDHMKTKQGYSNWGNSKIYGLGIGCEVAQGEGKIKINRFTQTMNGAKVGN